MGAKSFKAFRVVVAWKRPLSPSEKNTRPFGVIFRSRKQTFIFLILRNYRRSFKALSEVVAVARYKNPEKTIESCLVLSPQGGEWGGVGTSQEA